ncbi:hypothetical protein T4D_15374, partial [Trichinella pseudospiralis]
LKAKQSEQIYDTASGRGTNKQQQVIRLSSLKIVRDAFHSQTCPTAADYPPHIFPILAVP